MKVIHVNHSSLLISDGNCTLLTDPWYFVNAFDGWAPFPQPDARLIDEIINGCFTPDIILISHAHDDHLDERYLSKISDQTRIVIPEQASKSLKSRLIRCGLIESNIIKVGTQPMNVLGFSITSISNNTLSREDFIFSVSTSSGLVIHANDNWHRFTDNVVNHIRNISKYIPAEFRYLFAQVGVADSFPLFYTQIQTSEKLEIIANKCHLMLNALVANGLALQAGQVFAYANQSLFSASCDSSINPYLVRDQAIASFNPTVSQIMPSSTIIGKDIYNLYADYAPLIVERLRRLTNIFHNFANSRINRLTSAESLGVMRIEFVCLEYLDLTASRDNEHIQIASTIHQWNRILSGSANLESIITGGCGQIRAPNNYNMRAEYNILVEWSYMLQAKINSQGLFI